MVCSSSTFVFVTGDSDKFFQEIKVVLSERTYVCGQCFIVKEICFLEILLCRHFWSL